MIEKYTQCRAPRPSSAVILDIAKSSPDVPDGLFLLLIPLALETPIETVAEDPSAAVCGRFEPPACSRQARPSHSAPVCRLPTFPRSPASTAASPQYVLYCSWSLITGTLAGILLVGPVEIRVRCDFAGPHLGNDGADGSGQFSVPSEGSFVWLGLIELLDCALRRLKSSTSSPDAGAHMLLVYHQMKG